MAVATDAGRIVDNAVMSVVRGLSAARRVHQVSTSSNVWPGHMFAASDGSRSSSLARSQWRDMFNATGPLMPKCVHRSDPVSLVDTVPSVRSTSSIGCATPLSVPWIDSAPLASSSGTSAGVVGTIVCPSLRAISRPRHRRRFSHDCPPAENDARGPDISTARGEPESLAVPLHVEHARVGRECRASAMCLVEKRLEHIPRPLAIGKQLAVSFFVQRHADFSKERDRVADWKRAKDAADDRPPASPKVGVRHHGIRDVAAGAAADEDFGAGTSGALEQQNRAAGVQSPREDRGRKPGGAGADDGDITRTGAVGSQA
jgi:hypothetical protein